MTTEMAPSPTGAELRAMIEAEHADLVAIRHDLHRRPEVMFEERETAARVARELDALGIEHRTGLAGGTGVLAHLPATGSAQGPAVGLRADMDALPIQERTGAPYASEITGRMHACGHDGHTTILLGAARILSRLSNRPHPVTFVFQPAEEGGAGGDLMCRDGCLLGASDQSKTGLGTPVSRIFGLHGWPQIPLGSVATRSGPLLAATDEWTITFKGTQTHAAYPHLGADAIVAASHTIAALQTIASREVSPTDSIVITTGAIHGGSAHNVIPEEVKAIGTVRTLRDETRRLARERFFDIVEGVARSLRVHADIDWNDGYPVTHNDPELTDHFFRIASLALGEERVQEVQEPSMGGEDFSYYGKHVPACFFMLGLKPPGSESVPQLHQPEFDFNDDAIPLGVEMMCRLALSTE